MGPSRTRITATAAQRAIKVRVRPRDKTALLNAYKL